MEYLTQKDKVMLLTGEDELLSLKKVIGIRAMSLHEDTLCLKQGKKNSIGDEVSAESVELDMKVLNALSGALLAITS